MVPVMLALQPPKLLLQAPLPMAILHQAFALCQQRQLLCLHTGLLGLQLIVPGMNRGERAAGAWGGGKQAAVLSGPGYLPSLKHRSPAKPQGRTPCQVPTTLDKGTTMEVGLWV